MNIKETISNESFQKENQFKKRQILENIILKDEDCKVGNKVLCFEIERLVSDNFNFFYLNYNGGKNKIKSLTIGNEYEILDHSEGNIKIKNDDGNKKWYSINRFVFSLKMERKIKLNKIDDNKF